ncbi:MAG: peptidoglycan DD-metalloendopeptidase family protein [Staphylococcus equorum]|nr:peptidoglycan DD-metalloendopeptidase family protein [Staphylococcus equorum]
MAERIKGLQIDLSLNDMDVSKKLASVKREFSALNTSMKVSNNNFKYGDKSAASYKNRMSELQNAVDGSSKHLTQLKQRHAEVVAEQGAGSKAALNLANQINKETDAFNMFKSQLSSVTDEYRQNFSTLGKLSQSFKSVGSGMQTAGSKMQGVGRSLSNSITKPALVAGAAAAGLTAKLGFDRLVGLDTAKAKLEGLGYSTKEVGSITDQVAKAIDGGMTTMAEGTDVAAGALAAGVEQGKDLEKYIKLVGDAAVGSGRPVSEMAMIFNRVQGQGKLMTQELNMIEEGMPGFSNAMAKNLGVSYDEFRTMVTNGEVTAKDFMSTMDDFAGGMAGAYSKSWKGMVQNSKAYIGQIGEAFLSSTFQKAKGGLHEFEKMLKSPGAKQWAAESGEKLGNAFNTIGNGIKGLMNWWNGLNGTTQSVLGGLVKWLAITLITAGPVLTIFGKMTSVIGGMFSGMSTLISFLIRHNAASKASAAGQAIWNGVTASARAIANGYRAAVTALTTSQTIQAIKSKIAATAMVIWTGVTKTAAVATRGLGLAIRFMSGPIGWIITIVGALAAAIIYLWKTNSTFRNAVITSWNAIKNTAIAVFGFIKPYIINIWNAIKNSSIVIWNAMKKAASVTWNALKFAVQHPIQALRKTLTALWNGMKAAAIKIWTLLKNGVVAIIKAYVNQVRANFNLVKRIVVAVFNAIKAFSIKVWNGLKKSVINIVKGLKNGVINTFKALSKGIHSIFNAVKNFAIKLWTNIKNGVISRAKALWNSVRNTFNALNKGIHNIFNSVKNFALKLWTNVKNGVVSRAKALWSGVSNTFKALRKGVASIFTGVKNNTIKLWNTIKSKVTGIASSLWGSVKKTFNSMKDGLGNIIGKIKGLINGMVTSVKKGLNKLIDGVNWVGNKLGMDKLPKIKLHTGTEHTTTRNVVTNGKINRDTFATVGDKGKGNGPGGFRHEAIKYPNGKMALTPNRDTTAFLPKGSSVMNGAQTHSMLGGMPKFANGTNKKKKQNILEQGKHLAGTFGEKASDAAHGVKESTQKALEASAKAIGKGKKWLGEKVGDVMDWVGKPGKLFNKIAKAFGIDMASFGVPKSAELPFDMMKGMFGKLKTSAIDMIKGWMEDAGGDGDASWLFKHDIWQKFGKYSGGLNFNGGKHYGVDFGMPIGTPVKAVKGGKVDKVWNDYGGGNSVQVKTGQKEWNWYMHLSKQIAKQGQKIKAGQLIGKSGDTGNFVRGAHLHFQLMKGDHAGNDTAVDPLGWLKKLKGGGSKAASKWKPDVIKALKANGLPTSSKYVNAWIRQIDSESGGDAGATQHGYTDVNTGGNEAKGLVQVTPSTFRAYKRKGHGNILNGLDNLMAGMNYAKSRYGGSMLSVIGKGHGYATGGLINSAGLYNLAEEGHPEFVIPTDPSRQSEAMKLLAIASEHIGKRDNNKRPNQMRAPKTTVDTGSDNTDLLLQMIANQQKQLDTLMEIAQSNRGIESKAGFNEKDVSQAQGRKARLKAYATGGGLS